MSKTNSKRAFSGSARALAGAGLAAAIGAFLLSAQPSAANGDDNKTETSAPAASADSTDSMPGKELFIDWGCGSCHTLADVGADGHVGPIFDGDSNLTKDFIVNRVTYGQGAMPGFGGQLTDKEIGELADYLLKASAKPDSSS